MALGLGRVTDVVYALPLTRDGAVGVPASGEGEGAKIATTGGEVAASGDGLNDPAPLTDVDFVRNRLVGCLERHHLSGGFVTSKEDDAN